MKSEFQPHRQRIQSPEMETDSILNVLHILESDLFFDEDNVANFGTNAHAHTDGAASPNHDATNVLDEADNAIYQRSPMHITSNDIHHFTTTLETTTDNIPSFGI